MLKRIGDVPRAKVCLDRQHNPPTMIVLDDGTYEYTCPRCGRVTEFVVQKATLSATGWW